VQNRAINLLFRTKNIGAFNSELIYIENTFNISEKQQEKVNNITRDNSFTKLEEKILLINNKTNIVALFVIFPEFLWEIIEWIKKIKQMWFKRILFEIYIWNLYAWWENDYNLLYKKLLEVKNNNNIIIFNNYNYRDTILDISTDWKICSSSIDLFNENIDYTPKKELNKILNKIFN